MNMEDDETTESMHWAARWMLRWNGKSAVTRLYLAGLTFGIPAAIAWSIDPNRLATEVTIYVTFALLMVGLFHEIYVWTLPQIERPLVKLAIAALGLTGLLAWAFIEFTSLSGLSDENALLSRAMF